MNLYVWEGVLTDYTSGMAVALAPDPETAKKVVQKEIEGSRSLGDEGEVASWAAPKVIKTDRKSPVVFFVCGGG
jgi:hypothetical protein